MYEKKRGAKERNKKKIEAVIYQLSLSHQYNSIGGDGER